MLTRITSLVLVAACALAVAGCAPSTGVVPSPPVHGMVASAFPALLPDLSAPPKYVATLGSRGVNVRTVKRFEAASQGGIDVRHSVGGDHATTSWPALNRAIASIPVFSSGVATWVVTARYGHWGATDLGTGRIYISPRVPASKLYAVAVHEYAHALASHTYRRDWRAMGAAMDRWYGGGPVTGRERAADCMAKIDGATWTHYTSCRNAHWRAGARLLLAGRRL